jgi:molybdopterin molybdotransferase
MQVLLSVDDALERVLSRVRPTPTEVVALEAAAGRPLAADAKAAVDLPPFPSSAMDGYAVRAADAPGPLRVAAAVAAGHPVDVALGPLEAFGIATGGVVPEGADAVVPLELATHDGGTVSVPAGTRVGANVRARGGDVRAGSTVVPAGVVLTAGRLAALAAAGASTASVHTRPRVAVVATGSELKPPGEPLGPGEIYESNGVMLEAAAAAAGATVDRRVVIVDEPGAHRQALRDALDADVVVTSGGVSVGPHDLVRATLADLGVEEVFWGVAMRPGKPIAFGVGDRTLTFGLPGNPVSSLVGFVLFVAPALRALLGHVEPRPQYAVGILAATLERNDARDDFVRAACRTSQGRTVLEPVTGQESHMIVRSAAADALVHVPRGVGELSEGSAVRYLPI